jgi:hypothetical protein
LKGKKHLKAAEEQAKKTITVSSAMDLQPIGENAAPSASSGPSKVELKQKEIGRAEARIMKLAEILGQQREETKGHVELKQSRNPDEYAVSLFFFGHSLIRLQGCLRNWKA